MEIEEFIEKLKDIKLNRQNAADEIKFFMNKIGKKADVLFHLNSNHSIFRGRFGRENDFFCSESQLSYNPNPSKEYQRASVPNQTAFYGVVFNNSDIDSRNEQGTVLAEIYNKDFDLEKKTKITFGMWKVKEGMKLDLVAVIQDNLFLGKNKLFDELNKSYNEYLRELPDEIREKTRVYNSFIAKEFSKKEIKNNNDYKISAIYSELIFKNFDGIIYPSVRSNGLSLNVALKPETVDNKLYFKACSEKRIEKTEDGGLSLKNT